MDMALRVAAKAVIINDKNQILIVREAATYGDGTQIGRYGLPGGRLDIGESFYEGLAREIHEETGLTATPVYPIYVGEWRPNIKGVPYQIIAVFVACKAEPGAVILSDEHDSYAWIDPERRSEYAFMDPDDKVVDAYASRAM